MEALHWNQPGPPLQLIFHSKKLMKLCAFVIALVLAAAGQAQSLNKDFLQKLFSSVTADVPRVEEIPPSVMAELGAVAHDPSIRLANRNERYNSTDVVYSDRADRRLRFARCSPEKDYFLVCYDHGAGNSKQCVVMIHKLQSSAQASAVWAATISGTQGCNNLEYLKKAVARDDVVPYPLPFYIF